MFMGAMLTIHSHCSIRTIRLQDCFRHGSLQLPANCLGFQGVGTDWGDQTLVASHILFPSLFGLSDLIQMDDLFQG